MYILRQQEEMLNIPPVITRSQELGSTLFAILHSSLIRFYTICHSQQSDQGEGLHCHSQEQSDQGLQGQGMHYYFQEQSDQGLHNLPFEAVWSKSTLFAIHSSVIRVYTVCHS